MNFTIFGKRVLIRFPDPDAPPARPSYQNGLTRFTTSYASQTADLLGARQLVSVFDQSMRFMRQGIMRSRSNHHSHPHQHQCNRRRDNHNGNRRSLSRAKNGDQRPDERRIVLEKERKPEARETRVVRKLVSQTTRARRRQIQTAPVPFYNEVIEPEPKETKREHDIYHEGYWRKDEFTSDGDEEDLSEVYA